MQSKEKGKREKERHGKMEEKEGKKKKKKKKQSSRLLRGKQEKNKRVEDANVTLLRLSLLYD